MLEVGGQLAPDGEPVLRARLQRRRLVWMGDEGGPRDQVAAAWNRARAAASEVGVDGSPSMSATSTPLTLCRQWPAATPSGFISGTMAGLAGVQVAPGEPSRMRAWLKQQLGRESADG